MAKLSYFYSIFHAFWQIQGSLTPSTLLYHIQRNQAKTLSVIELSQSSKEYFGYFDKSHMVFFYNLLFLFYFMLLSIFIFNLDFFFFLVFFLLFLSLCLPHFLFLTLPHSDFLYLNNDSDLETDLSRLEGSWGSIIFPPNSCLPGSYSEKTQKHLGLCVIEDIDFYP